MEYLIKIENFEGPFDLLLHLIKQEELNIWEIEISTITDQYLRYLEAMKYQNLKVASEYLYMAAYLVEVKSRMLIPKEVIEIESDYQENPQELLIKQLLEYKRFKDLAARLNEQGLERRNYLDAFDSLKDQYTQTLTELKNNKDVEDLARILKKMYTQIALDTPVTSSMNNTEISMDHAKQTVTDMLKDSLSGTITLSKILNKLSLNDFVVTFLAILDMTKNQLLQLEQTQEDDILIKYTGGDDDE